MLPECLLSPLPPARLLARLPARLPGTVAAGGRATCHGEHRNGCRPSHARFRLPSQRLRQTAAPCHTNIAPATDGREPLSCAGMSGGDPKGAGWAAGQPRSLKSQLYLGGSAARASPLPEPPGALKPATGTRAVNDVQSKLQASQVGRGELRGRGMRGISSALTGRARGLALIRRAHARREGASRLCSSPAPMPRGLGRHPRQSRCDPAAAERSGGTMPPRAVRGSIRNATCRNRGLPRPGPRANPSWADYIGRPRARAALFSAPGRTSAPITWCRTAPPHQRQPPWAAAWRPGPSRQKLPPRCLRAQDPAAVAVATPSSPNQPLQPIRRPAGSLSPSLRGSRAAERAPESAPSSPRSRAVGRRRGRTNRGRQGASVAAARRGAMRVPGGRHRAAARCLIAAADSQASPPARRRPARRLPRWRRARDGPWPPAARSTLQLRPPHWRRRPSMSTSSERCSCQAGAAASATLQRARTAAACAPAPAPGRRCAAVHPAAAPPARLPTLSTRPRLAPAPRSPHAGSSAR